MTRDREAGGKQARKEGVGGIRTKHNEPTMLAEKQFMTIASVCVCVIKKRIRSRHTALWD